MIDMQSIVAMMYKDTCTIVERQKVKDPSTKKTEFKEVIVLKDQPCRLAYKSFPETSVDNVARMTQQVKLFLSPQIKVNVGSKLIVTQKYDSREDLVTEFSSSGVPAVYPSHQEISLELFERWA